MSRAGLWFYGCYAVTHTYLIREVHPHDPELDASGEPLEYNFYNIYSQRYVAQLLGEIGGFTEHRIEPDTEFFRRKSGTVTEWK